MCVGSRQRMAEGVGVRSGDAGRRGAERQNVVRPCRAFAKLDDTRCRADDRECGEGQLRRGRMDDAWSAATAGAGALVLVMTGRVGIVASPGRVLHGRVVRGGEHGMARMRRLYSSRTVRRACAKRGRLDPDEDEPDRAKHAEEPLRPMATHKRETMSGQFDCQQQQLQPQRQSLQGGSCQPTVSSFRLDLVPELTPTLRPNHLVQPGVCPIVAHGERGPCHVRRDREPNDGARDGTQARRLPWGVERVQGQR